MSQSTPEMGTEPTTDVVSALMATTMARLTENRDAAVAWGSGWTCAGCGQWANAHHVCPRSPMYPVPQYTPPDPLAANTAALNRLAAAIEKLAHSIEMGTRDE
jgi:ribosomal protein L32